MSKQRVWNVETYLTVRLQKAQERRHMLGQAMLVHPTQPYIQKIALAKTPAVPFKVGTKIKFRKFRRDRAAGAQLSVHFEFGFLGDNRLFPAGFCASEARDRAKMAACPYYQPGSKLAVRDPPAVAALERR